MSSGQVQTIPLKPIWLPTVWNQYEIIGEVRPLRGLLCVPNHRFTVMCSGTWHSMPHHGAVPLKPGFSQKVYMFWKLWMTFWLQGNIIPLVCIFLDALLYTEGKMIVPEDLCSLSISAMGCWLGKPRGFRAVSSGRCSVFPSTVDLCCRACDTGMTRLLPGFHHRSHVQPCRTCPRCCNMGLKILVYPMKVLGRQTSSVLLAKLLSTFWLKGILKVHSIFPN